MREPLGRLEVLLLQRGVQHAQSPYLAGGGRVVALDVCLGLAVRGLEGERAGSLFFFASEKTWLGKRSLLWEGREVGDVPPSCGAGTRSSPQARARISPCRCRPRRLCW